jgi:hypothetical protein
MIDSSKRSIIAVHRQADNSWKFEDLDEKNGDLLIETINFRIHLSELYEGTGL